MPDLAAALLTRLRSGAGFNCNQRKEGGMGCKQGGGVSENPNGGTIADVAAAISADLVISGASGCSQVQGVVPAALRARYLKLIE